ncbi:MAG: DinB family protein [Acidobacteriota bacterium]
MSRVFLSRVLAALCALSLLTTPVLADNGYLKDFGADFDGVTKKMNDLADAIPADKYGWALTDEVFTVSESLVHVAMANFFLCQALGVPMPEDVAALGQEAQEKVTAKKDVMALLARSQDQVRKAHGIVAGGDLGEEIQLFGGTRSKRGVFMTIAGHNHEHLGNLIAYARSNRVVPPWSRPQGDDE